MRATARRFGLSLLTVQRWVERAGDDPLELIDWSDRSSAPHRQQARTPSELEDEILRLRRVLRGDSLLGEYGAEAIQRELLASGRPVPSVRTIGRILARRGVLDARGRVRRAAPPAGWYLPAVAARRVELDQVDAIEGLRLLGGIDIEILTLISLHGGLPGAWPHPPLVTALVIDALVGHWREHGRPGYVQFDNAMIFAGSHGRPDLGRVGRMCLGLGVVPVFAPPREMGFQASIESFNGRWQARLWRRFHEPGLDGVRARSDAWIAAARARSAARIEAAPARPPVPVGWVPGEPLEPRGLVIYLRRTNERGEVSLLRQRFPVATSWPYRLVRAEVDLDHDRIRFYALRRREPDEQPLLRETPFVAPWPGRR
jgi:hypothetical protein